MSDAADRIAVPTNGRKPHPPEGVESPRPPDPPQPPDAAPHPAAVQPPAPPKPPVAPKPSLPPLTGEPPIAAAAGSEAAASDLSDRAERDQRLSLAFSPRQMAVGFGVIASLVLLAAGRARRRQ